MKDICQPEREPEVGAVYRITSRNLSVGVYVGDGLFIGIREKFGSRFLDTEGFNGPGFVRLGYRTYHSTHDFAGSFVPSEEPIGRIEGIPLTERGDPPSVCSHCRGPAHDADPKPDTAPVAYRVCENGCPPDDPRWGVSTYWNGNTPLFEALDEFERKLFPDELNDWHSRRSKFDPRED